MNPIGKLKMTVLQNHSKIFFKWEKELIKTQQTIAKMERTEPAVNTEMRIYETQKTKCLKKSFGKEDFISTTCVNIQAILKTISF